VIGEKALGLHSAAARAVWDLRGAHVRGDAQGWQTPGGCSPTSLLRGTNGKPESETPT